MGSTAKREGAPKGATGWCITKAGIRREERDLSRCAAKRMASDAAALAVASAAAASSNDLRRCALHRRSVVTALAARADVVTSSRLSDA